MRFIAAALALLLWSPSAEAARVRLHYVPDAQGVLQLQGSRPVTPSGRGYFGSDRFQPKPNTCAAFTHPYSGKNVSVPLALPADTPQMVYRFARTIYNYGSYTVEVAFLPDGSVDVVYNSGLLRGL